MVNPYNNNTGKKNEVRAMFNSIARSYDFLNHFLSFGVDYLWRRRTIKELKKYAPERILDMATGTGDLAILASKIHNTKIVGIDLSAEMIEVGKKKIGKRDLESRIKLEVGDSENIHYPDSSFDAAMVAFGVRNFENLELGLKELNRVLKKQSPLLILEFSQPTSFPFKQLYHFYSFKFLPFFGRMVSKDPRAYTYLPESIKSFPNGERLIGIMENCGFDSCRFIPLSFKIATIYIGHKA